ncbi:MAG TPA: hypothetical protein VMG12_07905 [Polyangiaceae bacterium]|nr:hypothetical protein [Polyangiaceae bacterium]
MWSRFGRDRYGGRFVERVPDCIQDCYVILLRKGGLDSFRLLDNASSRLHGFRGWLWAVVDHHCNATLTRWTKKPPPPPRPSALPNPEAAFFRQFYLTVVQASIERVRRDREARGRGEDFRVLVGFVIGDGTTHEDLASTLDKNVGHARVLVCELRRALRAALRREVMDTLALPPGIAPEQAKKIVEREVDEIMSAWSGADDDEELDES